MSQVTDRVHTACTAQCSVNSPLGPVLLARTAKGLAGAWFEGQKHHPGVLAAPVRPDDPLLEIAAAQLQRYFTGKATAFDLPLDLLGTTFQQAVWQALLAIPTRPPRFLRCHHNCACCRAESPAVPAIRLAERPCPTDRAADRRLSPRL